MRYYSICLNIRGKKCIVVGGGRVAARKAKGLLESEALVHLISPDLNEALQGLLHEGAISWQQKKYQKGDISGAYLVMAATDDPAVQELVREDADRFNVLLNVADVPEKCDFILPAQVKRGSLNIAVSTGGKSPALAKKLRKQLERQFGPEYQLLNDLLGVLRPEVLRLGLPQSDNEHIFTEIIEGNLLELIAKKDYDSIRGYLEECLGALLPQKTVARIEKILQE